MNFDQNAVDIDFDGGESKEPAGIIGAAERTAISTRPYSSLLLLIQTFAPMN
jgi:hypothetical protein